MPRIVDLSFLHMVPQIDTTPHAAHEGALELFELGERLGYDSAWVFVRHLQRGLSSPVAFLSAASQRTRRIGLGAAVIPVEYEHPLTLAEGLSTADVLAGGRVQAGVSTHAPRFTDDENARVFGDGWREEDYSYTRLARFRALLREREPLVESVTTAPGALWSGRVEPDAPGLAERIWQGGGSLRSARWAGAHGFDLLLSNVGTSIDGNADYAENQRRLIEAYREETGGRGRVKIGLVVVPTDDATPAQRERFDAYARSRVDRTGVVGPDGTVLAADLHGSSARIAEQLAAHLTHVDADEFMAILPFTFEQDDYRRILAVFAERIAPALGWTPASASSRTPSDD